MRTGRGVAVTVSSSLLLLTGLLAPARASSSGPLGGEQLATRGTVVAAGAPALPPMTASAWLVADLDSGAVLASHDAHGRYAPASTLKALTAETLIPKLDPEAKIKPTRADLLVDGSKVGLVEQIAYPVRELFTAMLVVSGNDAANTLATANGGVPKTVAEMNAEAARLQALDTHAVNANGLDDPHQLSSPYDLALIGRAAMQLPDFRAYVKIKSTKIEGPGGKSIPIGTHDRLLWNYDGAIGIKNGYTVKAQATFIGAATRGGHTLVVTLMHDHPRYWPEAAALLDWGFAAEKRGVLPVGQLVDPVPDAPAAATVTTTRVQAAASHASVSSASGLPVRRVLLAAALLVPLLVVRSRRRRPRKMALPRPPR